MLQFLTLLSLSISQIMVGNTLVLMDDITSKDSYSSFFELIKSKNYKHDIRPADQRSLSLKRFGDFAYDNLIILGSSVDEFGGSVDLDEILNFLDSGRNVFVALHEHTRPLIRMLGYECGIEIDGEMSQVLDHFNVVKDLDDGQHSTFLVDSKNMLNSNPMGQINGPVLFNGIGMVVDSSNDLAIKVLHASSTAYPSSQKQKVITKYPLALGQSLALISGIQTLRTNGRALFVGSTDMLTDKFMNYNSSFGNKQLAANLIDWTFKTTGFIRIKSVNHSLATKGTTPSQYTINDVMLYQIEIEEYKNDEWTPFVAQDVQLELKKVDTFIRVFMNTSGNGMFTAEVRLPDVYGVFKLIVDYRRVGYSSIEYSAQVTIRPLRHDQYDRYIVQAYPYYVVIFLMMISLGLFVMVWLGAHAEYTTTMFEKVKGD